MSIKIEARKKRVNDIYANMARWRVQLKDVAEQAGLNYNSLTSNLPNYKVSKERLDLLEEALNTVVDRKIAEQKRLAEIA